MLKGGGCLGCMEIPFPPGTRRGEVASLYTNEFPLVVFNSNLGTTLRRNGEKKGDQ